MFDDDSAGVTTQAKYDTDARTGAGVLTHMQAKGDIVQKTSDFANGGVSFWFRDIGLPSRRAPLTGPIDVDVAIVGAGLTGLWTAYYLAKAVPELSVAILEKEFAGFGASGRNGGWLSGEPAGQFRRYAKAHGSHRAKELQQHMFSSIDEVIEVAKNEGIEADIVKDGLIHVATNNAQLRRLTHHVEELRTQGWDGNIADPFGLPRGERLRGRRLGSRP